MRKKELNMLEYKNKYDCALVAMIFMPNRVSQKLGRWVNIFHIPMSKVASGEAITVPINFKKYKNPKTITKRLKEFDFVLVHETDIDVIEKLKELNVDFRVLPIEIKKGWYKYKDKAPHISYDVSNWYVMTNFLKLYDMIPKTVDYYRVDNEYTYPVIRKITINPRRNSVSPFMFKTKKEAYYNFVNNLQDTIKYYSKNLKERQRLLDYFINHYKGEFGNEQI